MLGDVNYYYIFVVQIEFVLNNMKNELTTTTLADHVEEKIIEYIKENDLTPGDSLPNEMYFSETMGISRNVVRESMSRLRMLGLIKSRTKRGMVITEPPLLIGFQKVLDPQFLSIGTMKELMGVRISLEIGLSELLFSNLKDEDIETLEKIVAIEKAIEINNPQLEDEIRFHSNVYKIAGNNFIYQFNKIIHPVVVFAKQNYENFFQPINQLLLEKGEIVTHQDLLNKIKNRDKNGYIDAIKGHLKPYMEFMSSALK